MSKRFTDTDKWKMAWFRKLGSQGRDIWNYLHDNCDFAGFFEVDCERMSFELGFDISFERLLSVLNGKVIIVSSDRIFLPAFIDFQYGTLNETVKPHQAVIRKMKNQRVWELYESGSYTAKEQEQEQERDKDKEGVKGEEKRNGGLPGAKLSGSPHQGVIDYFFEKFLEATGEKMHVNGKTGALVKSLLKTYEPERLRALIDLFFESEDEFILKSGKDFGVFYSQVNKLVSAYGGGNGKNQRDPNRSREKNPSLDAFREWERSQGFAKPLELDDLGEVPEGHADFGGGDAPFDPSAGSD